MVKIRGLCAVSRGLCAVSCGSTNKKVNGGGRAYRASELKQTLPVNQEASSIIPLGNTDKKIRIKKTKLVPTMRVQGSVRQTTGAVQSIMVLWSRCANSQARKFRFETQKSLRKVRGDRRAPFKERLWRWAIYDPVVGDSPFYGLPYCLFPC